MQSNQEVGPLDIFIFLQSLQSLLGNCHSTVSAHACLWGGGGGDNLVAVYYFGAHKSLAPNQSHQV